MSGVWCKFMNLMVKIVALLRNDGDPAEMTSLHWGRCQKTDMEEGTFIQGAKVRCFVAMDQKSKASRSE